MGLNSFIIRAVGSIPGPLIGGALMDTSCMLWQSNCDGSKTCRLYNRDKMMIVFLCIHLCYKGIITQK